MRSRNCKSVLALAALVLASGITSAAVAQCGLPTKLVRPSDWSANLGGVHLMRTANSEFDDHDGPSIVGMWHVSFIAETADPATAPPGSMIDNALVVWHSDGTEIMNSMRPPQDGNFCLGVWERVGPRTYKLNHIPWFSKQFPTGPDDEGTTIGPSVGPTQITEEVTLSPDGQHYSGTFTLVAYSTTNAIIQTFTGKVSATRVTVSTKEPSLM